MRSQIWLYRMLYRTDCFCMCAFLFAELDESRWNHVRITSGTDPFYRVQSMKSVQRLSVLTHVHSSDNEFQRTTCLRGPFNISIENHPSLESQFRRIFVNKEAFAFLYHFWVFKHVDLCIKISSNILVIPLH